MNFFAIRCQPFPTKKWLIIYLNFPNFKPKPSNFGFFEKKPKKGG